MRSWDSWARRRRARRSSLRCEQPVLPPLPLLGQLGHLLRLRVQQLPQPLHLLTAATVAAARLVPVFIFVGASDEACSEARELERLLLHRALEPQVDLFCDCAGVLGIFQLPLQVLHLRFQKIVQILAISFPGGHCGGQRAPDTRVSSPVVRHNQRLTPMPSIHVLPSADGKPSRHPRHG